MLLHLCRNENSNIALKTREGILSYRWSVHVYPLFHLVLILVFCAWREFRVPVHSSSRMVKLYVYLIIIFFFMQLCNFKCVQFYFGLLFQKCIAGSVSCVIFKQIIVAPFGIFNYVCYLTLIDQLNRLMYLFLEKKKYRISWLGLGIKSKFHIELYC